MAKKYAICLGFGDEYIGTGMARLPFAYKNVLDFSMKLDQKGYTVFQTIPESEATKQKIKDHFFEKINLLQPDDWLLFYYVGHGDITFNPSSGNEVTTYLVTSFTDFDPALDYLNFFTDDDYAAIITAFRQKAPGGHLITILDCCYAFGMVDAFQDQEQFHTIISASSFDKKAFYDTNSFFFQAIQAVWDKQLATVINEVPKIMRELNDASRCQCQLAAAFDDEQL
jgi:hypothetical protein